jgi:hypothetical protein
MLFNFSLFVYQKQTEEKLIISIYIFLSLVDKVRNKIMFLD